MTVSGGTRVFGVTGWPVEHSLSPAMHNAGFGALGMDAVYVPFPIAPGDLEAAVRGLFAAGLAGLNVTIPHKEEMLAVVDDLSPIAAGVGAVNTAWVERGVLRGDNTDVAGLMRAAARDGVLLGGKVVVLGAGGAAKAAVHAVMLSGGDAVVLNRTVERAEDLAESVNTLWEAERVEAGALYEADAAEALRNAAVLINATSVGMGKPAIRPERDDTPFPWIHLLRPDVYVLDTVYVPAETRLLREAKAADCQTRNGLAMLVEQGAESFRLWTGREPAVEAMEEAALTALAARE